MYFGAVAAPGHLMIPTASSAGDSMASKPTLLVPVTLPTIVKPRVIVQPPVANITPPSQGLDLSTAPASSGGSTGTGNTVALAPQPDGSVATVSQGPPPAIVSAAPTTGVSSTGNSWLWIGVAALALLFLAQRRSK